MLPLTSLTLPCFVGNPPWSYTLNCQFGVIGVSLLTNSLSTLGSLIWPKPQNMHYMHSKCTTTWSIRNGVHCMGCHGQGHQISDCLLALYMAPYDLRLPTHRLGPGGSRRPFFDPASWSGTRDT